MSEDEDWTTSPQRYAGMNAGPGYDPVPAPADSPQWLNLGFVHTDGDSHRFITKDSGDREEFPTGMKRDTSRGKVEWALVMPLGSGGMFQRWAELMTRGAEKYDKRNWELAETEEEYQRFKESAFRHFMQWYLGETDEDHAAAVYFNIQGAEYVKGKL